MEFRVLTSPMATARAHKSLGNSHDKGFLVFVQPQIQIFGSATYYVHTIFYFAFIFGTQKSSLFLSDMKQKKGDILDCLE